MGNIDTKKTQKIDMHGGQKKIHRIAMRTKQK